MDVATRPAPRRASHRLPPGDPDKYLTKRCDRWQVRPWKDGERHYLGSFPLAEKRAAQRARDEFLAGHRQSIPKFLRGYRSKKGIAIRIEMMIGSKMIVRAVADPGQAAAIVYRDLVKRLGKAGAKEAIKRK